MNDDMESLEREIRAWATRPPARPTGEFGHRASSFANLEHACSLRFSHNWVASNPSAPRSKTSSRTWTPAGCGWPNPRPAAGGSTSG